MINLKPLILDPTGWLEATWVDEEEKQVYCQSFHPTQMQMLRDKAAEYGTSLTRYQALMAQAEANYIPPGPPSAEELARKAQEAKNETDIVAAKAYTKLAALRNMSPGEVQTWVGVNVNTLAQAKDAITTLAIAVSILARRL